MAGFKEVAPGILVNTDSDLRVSVYYPNPCSVLISPDRDALIVSQTSRSIIVFTSQNTAQAFVDRTGIQGMNIEEMSWNEFVDLVQKMSPGSSPSAIVDHKGEEGFYPSVQVRKYDE